MAVSTLSDSPACPATRKRGDQTVVALVSVREYSADAAVVAPTRVVSLQPTNGSAHTSARRTARPS
jgi:hypothetical protein